MSKTLLDAARNAVLAHRSTDRTGPNAFFDRTQSMNTLARTLATFPPDAVIISAETLKQAAIILAERSYIDLADLLFMAAEQANSVAGVRVDHAQA